MRGVKERIPHRPESGQNLNLGKQNRIAASIDAHPVKTEPVHTRAVSEALDQEDRLVSGTAKMRY